MAPNWPRSKSWFASCASETDLLEGPQTATLAWLIQADWPGVWPVASTFNTLGWAPARVAPGGLLSAHDVPNGGRLVITPAGPSLWVPGKRTFDYRKVYRLFLGHFGFRGRLETLDIDHVVSRGAYYRRRHALTPRRAAGPRDEWFLLMAARAHRNRHWGHWEGVARTTGMLGFMSILKSLDQRSPLARDRADHFVTYGTEMAGLITPLLGWKSHAVLPNPLVSGTPEAAAAQALGLGPGELVDTERWVAWAITSEAMEVRGVP
jgi:hypothetical protein